ncbi:MAG: hypothetical protein GX780_01060 [Campylobacteraceae bacterium]|nr:hypothetical protein [Campylobacteraceae bacterium]
MLKEAIHTGLGAAVLLKERVEAEIKKLEERGKLGKADAKEFLNSIESRGKEEEASFKAKLKETFEEIIKELNLATKDDIESLRKELK